MRIGPVAAFLVLLGFHGAALFGQQRTLRVYLDCQTYYGCDFDFFRRQIPYVNWVRDRQDADVHILISSQATGGGGQHFEISFLGGDRFEGRDEDLALNTSGDATTDGMRRAISLKLEVGLVAYLVDTPVAERLRVSVQGEQGADTARSPREGGPPPPGTATPAADPWHFWVFQISGSVQAIGESSTRYAYYSGRVSANRTTAAWRVGLASSYYSNEQTYELSTGTTKSVRKDWSVSSYAVRSMGAQWALGLQATGGSSTYYNQDVYWTLQPGVEYDFFPYKESSRRSLTLQYLVGPKYFNYGERTIYGHLSEIRPQQVLIARLSLIQPWGSWSTSVTGAQYLPQSERNHLTVGAGLNVRLFKGFSVNLSSDYTWLHDQIYIRATGLSDQEILLKQHQLSTQFESFTYLSIQYRFGSIFNNVVNPRFGSVSSQGGVSGG